MRQRQQYTLTARTASFTGDEFTLENAAGVLASIDVTAVPGVDTVTLKLQQKVAGDKWVDIPGAATTARAAVGTDVLCVAPGVGAIANQAVAYAPAGAVRMVVTHSAATAFDYTLRLEPVCIG